MSNKQKQIVLIIDDDPDIVDIICDSLAESGFQMIVSFNMEDALHNFENINYDLIISDIFMKGMGGIEGIVRIRSLQPDARIIAISGGYSDISPEDALHAASEMGANAILPKPFAPDVLEQMVYGLLENAA